MMLIRMKHRSAASHSWKVKIQRAKRRLRGIFAIMRVIRAERIEREKAVEALKSILPGTEIPRDMVLRMQASLKAQLEGAKVKVNQE